MENQLENQLINGTDSLEHAQILINVLRDFKGVDVSSVSDGYHTFAELYEFRKMYNAALFNEWAKQGKYDVHKSWLHNDGEPCFGKPNKWFIVVAVLPKGQISNHYKLADWDLFQIPETSKAKYPFDGHSPKDVLDRLKNECLTIEFLSQHDLDIIYAFKRGVNSVSEERYKLIEAVQHSTASVSERMEMVKEILNINQNGKN